MENLNAEQIKYCLELILKSGIGMSRDDVDVTDIKRALALITSQEERIKELTEDKAEIWEERNRIYNDLQDWKAIAEGYQKQFEDCAEDRARLTEENERLENALIEQSAENVMLIGENKRLRAELEQRPPKLIITKLPKKENENV